MILSASYSTLRGLVSRGCMLTLNQLKDFLYKFQGHITYLDLQFKFKTKALKFFILMSSI